MNWVELLSNWGVAVGTIALAIVAVLAMVPARQTVREMREQAEIQKDLARQQAQPYVWAGIEADYKQGSGINLKVQNEGPSIAKNIHVTIDPPFVNPQWQPERVASVQKQLSDGIKSLAPGQELKWYIGQGQELMVDSTPDVLRTITVNADGPYGPIDTLEFEIRAHDWALATDDPDGSLHLVRKELGRIVEALDGVKKKIPAAPKESSGTQG